MTVDEELELATLGAITGSRATEALLLEIVDAMRARNLLTRGDVAGAFFRAKWVMEEQESDPENPTRITASQDLALMEANWSKRMSFHPDMAALRHRYSAWAAAGEKGPHPAGSAELVRVYAEAENAALDAEMSAPVPQRGKRPRPKTERP